MNIQKRTAKSIAALFGAGILMALCCTLLYRFDNKYTYPGDTGMNGIAVLDENSFQAQPVVFLVRGWEFYQHKLLSPEDFRAGSPVPDAYVYIGQHGGFELGDPDADPHGSATYRIRIDLPDTPRVWALELPEIYSSCRVYVNGVLLAERGDPDLDEYRPEIKTGVLTFLAEGQAEILIAASDYSHLYSGLVYPPAFGLPEAVSAIIGRRLVLRVLIAFAALMAGLVFLIDALRTKEQGAAYYGAACLFFMGYTCYPIIQAIGWAGPLLWYRIENVCYCLTFLMVLMLQSKLCNIPRWITGCAGAYGGGMCVAAAVAGAFFQSLNGMMLYSSLISAYKLFIIVYLLATTIYAGRKKSLDPLLQLAGITAFCVSLLMNKLLPLHEPIFTGWFPELGGAALVICLGCVIYRNAALSRQEALALRDEIGLMEERVSHADSQLAMQRERLLSLQKDIEETRRSKHDLRHHILLMQKMLTADPEKAREYLQELDASLPVGADTLCKNLAVDCIVRQYADLAQKDGITMETAVDLPEKPGISDIDLCVIFSNLLENALEALQGETKDKRRIIRVTAGVIGKMLTINVDNSFGKPPRFRRGALMSSKRDAPGIGLGSVRAVANKHNGEFIWRTADDMFRASVVLMTDDRMVG